MKIEEYETDIFIPRNKFYGPKTDIDASKCPPSKWTICAPGTITVGKCCGIAEFYSNYETTFKYSKKRFQEWLNWYYVKENKAAKDFGRGVAYNETIFGGILIGITHDNKEENLKEWFLKVGFEKGISFINRVHNSKLKLFTYQLPTKKEMEGWKWVPPEGYKEEEVVEKSVPLPGNINGFNQMLQGGIAAPQMGYR